MDAVIQSFLSGFPVLLLHSSVTLAMLAMGVFLYVKITPYDEIELVQAGNTAAAASLAGAIIGLAIPLAFSMASSVTIWEILIWGPVTLLLQVSAYRFTDLVLEGLPKRIIDGEMGSALVLISIKLAVAVVNAAAVTA